MEASWEFSSTSRLWFSLTSKQPWYQTSQLSQIQAKITILPRQQNHTHNTAQKKPQVQSWSICFTLFLWQCQSFEVIFYSNRVDFHFFASYGRTTSLFSYNESQRKQDLDNNTSLTHFSSLAVLLLLLSLSVLTALKTQLYFQLSSTTETSQVRPKTVKAVALRLSTWKSFSVTLSLSALWH